MKLEGRKQLLRLLVERITIQKGVVRIETVFQTGGENVQMGARCPEHVQGWGQRSIVPSPDPDPGIAVGGAHLQTDYGGDCSLGRTTAAESATRRENTG